MCLSPTKAEVEEYIKVEFQPISADLLVADGGKSTKVLEEWQKDLHSSIRCRLKGVNPFEKGWKATADQVCITAEEVCLMLERYPPGKRDQRRKHLERSADKANYIINVLLGRIPTKYYRDIERPAFDISDSQYQAFLQDAISQLLNSDPAKVMYNLFYLPGKIRCINDQGRLPKNLKEQRSENLPAMQCMRSGTWNDRYGFICVFGHSPQDSTSALSKESIKKADLAIERKGPQTSTKFITSGGSVRPFLTPVVEAFELKKYLAEHGIHKDRILTDAASEHTNTNVWNAALLAYEAGMPFDKQMIAFLIPDQFEYVRDEMEQRTKEELQPNLYDYLIIEPSTEFPNSIVIGFKESFKTCPKQRLQWRNHVGKGIGLV